MARDYRLGPRIGQGGMAEVFLAVQAGPERFAKLVVQKRVRGAIWRRPDLGRGFLAEARLLARLSHPNLVQVLDLGWDERGPFVVVEYLSGETLSAILREVVASGRVIPWPLVTRMAAGLAAGLAAAHGASDSEGRADPILHRDVTPSNVIVCYSGAAKIIDFGIAKLAAEVGDTRTGTVKGKLSYLAPEILRGVPASPSSDLFQLGVTLFEALTGRRLFDAGSDAGRVQAVLHRPILAPGQVVHGLPVALDRIALGLLAREPELRTGTAEQVRSELDAVLRRAGQHVSEHEVGAWLRGAMPVHLAERVQRERDCLQSLAGPVEPSPARTRAATATMSTTTAVSVSTVTTATATEMPTTTLTAPAFRLANQHRLRRIAVAASAMLAGAGLAMSVLSIAGSPRRSEPSGVPVPPGEASDLGPGEASDLRPQTSGKAVEHRAQTPAPELVPVPVPVPDRERGLKADRGTGAVTHRAPRARRRPRRPPEAAGAAAIPPDAETQSPVIGPRPQASPPDAGPPPGPRTDNLDPWSR
ncbi:MAG TPA: serine/threonine-protein kinase [Kofleriaceae bacterium]|nr:serine/threonine-protein kinase [Kofleriaceae bacterium]